jgi:curli biogenesis system outer membrane secretion channel CsgG
MTDYRNVVWLLLLALLAAGGCAAGPDVINAQELARVKTVAVLPFADAPGYNAQNSGQAVSGFVTTELVAWGRYKIAERSRLNSVVSEQDLQDAQLTDADAAMRIGKLLGVDAIIVGSASQYDMDKTQVYLHVIPLVSRDYKVGISVRMIDTTSGQVIYAHSASGQSGSNFTEAGQRAARQLLGPIKHTQ